MRIVATTLALATAGVVYGQDADASVAAMQRQYNGQKTKLLAAAQAMPEDGYTLVPGDGSRTFAAVIGHIADAQGNTCGNVVGTLTRLNAEQGMKTKAELVAALQKSFEVCDQAYSGTNAANHDAAIAGGFGGPQPRNAVLWGNLVHSEEMYGTAAVYLRIKGVVPPSSAGRGGGKGKGKGKGE